MADPDRPHPPQPYRYPPELTPPPPPAPAPGEITRVCGQCFTGMPVTHMGERADSLICTDTAACAARAAASGIYPQPAER
jgi:hypothetical protein